MIHLNTLKLPSCHDDHDMHDATGCTHGRFMMYPLQAFMGTVIFPAPARDARICYRNALLLGNLFTVVPSQGWISGPC